jgi:hypothetical protein
MLNIDFRAASKEKVRPVRYGKHIGELEYKDMQRRLNVNDSI